ncbi:MAG: hypothetical protein GY799_34570, partial [Desulfobulbaceae bacterium]|nr:hypothetical protein [Desulfobulbaceae bacterium]
MLQILENILQTKKFKSLLCVLIPVLLLSTSVVNGAQDTALLHKENMSLQRKDYGRVLYKEVSPHGHYWVPPYENYQGSVQQSLRHLAVNFGGSIEYEIQLEKNGSCRIAIALCEGYWKETGKRVQVLKVEGADSLTVDLIA